MDKFSYGTYDSSITDIAYDSTKGYVEPSGEQEVRKELSYPLKELKDYINQVIPVNADDSVILLRLTEDLLFQYSLDGENWYDTASGGHQIFDEDENQLPQKTKMMFRGTTVHNEGEYTVVEGMQGAQGIGVASVVQVSSSSVSEGQNVWRMTLTNGNTYDFVVLNGAQGEEGEKGDQGNGLVILGTYSALEDLQQAHPTGNEGDIYIVGTGDSNPAYVWDVDNQAWESIGKIRGEKGAKGDTGSAGATGVGIQSIVETQHSSASGGTNIWTVTLTNGATNTFTVLNGEAGTAGEGMPQGGTSGQLLAKRTSLNYDTEWVTFQALPNGGTQGQVLTKQSSTDGDADWEDIDALPSGGTQGQVLTKNSSTDGDASWQTIQSGGGTVIYDDDGITSPIIAYDELTFLDVASGVDTVKLGIEMELLWTNSSPTASFSAQTITLDLSEYQAVIIIFRWDNATSEYLERFYAKGNSVVITESFARGTYGVTGRYINNITNSGVEFGNGIQNSWASNNNNMIPYQIYGIR